MTYAECEQQYDLSKIENAVFYIPKNDYEDLVTEHLQDIILHYDNSNEGYIKYICEKLEVNESKCTIYDTTIIDVTYNSICRVRDISVSQILKYYGKKQLIVMGFSDNSTCIHLVLDSTGQLSRTRVRVDPTKDEDLEL